MKSFSELTSASQVNNADLLAISQTSGSGYASKKTTVKEIADKSNLNLAEEYDSTSTYAVDDYVIYESVLYKCISATTGTFDSTKWTSVVVTDEMGSGGGGGTGGHTIIDENGNSMTARAGLQFVGANVSDDATNNKTIVDVASAGGIDGVFPDLSNDLGVTFTFDSTQHTWEATEDCAIGWNLIAIDSGTGAYIDIIDGADSLRVFNSYEYQHGAGGWALVKKGQTVSYRAKASTSGGGFVSSMKAYGIQTGTTHSKFQPVVYSFEEREIGVWTDGKPLYQKTCQIASNTSVGAWTTITLTSPILNPEYIVKAEFNDGTPSGYGQKTYLFRADNGNVQVKTTDGSSTTFNAGWHFTLWYTKSTDTAGSGSWTPQGVPTHHYSTDEQVIGTWISRAGNEVPLYEKTFRLGSGSSTGSTTLDENLLSNLGIAEITDGYIYVWDNNVEERIILKYNTNTKKITSIPSGSHYYTHVTVQYTKAI